MPRDRIFRPLPRALPATSTAAIYPTECGFTGRSSFEFREHPHYMPSHEARALQRLPRVLSTVDGVVEVRDARAPFSTAPTGVKGEKKRLIVFNKADLITPDLTLKIRKIFPDSLFTSALFNKNIARIKNQILDRIPLKHTSLGLRLALVGMPNVGKSSLIASLKADTLNKVNMQCIDKKVAIKIENKHNLKVNKLPGSTKDLSEFVINHKPLIKLLDTPGVTFKKEQPHHLLEGHDAMIERNVILATLGIFPDHIYGERNIADYILWRLNRRGLLTYVDFFDLTGPTDSIDQLLMTIAQTLANGRQLDLLTAARCFIRNFREGKLGKICLDHVPDDWEQHQWHIEPPSPWGPEKYQQ